MFEYTAEEIDYIYSAVEEAAANRISIELTESLFRIQSPFIIGIQRELRLDMILSSASSGSTYNAFSRSGYVSFFIIS